VRPSHLIVSLALAGGLAALLAATGCDGDLKYSRAKLAEKCRTTFEDEVKPLLEGSCATCHLSGDFAFMHPAPDLYTAVLTFPSLVELSDPIQSRLLAKGSHDGPAWTTEQYRTIKSWINLEESLRQVEPLRPVSTVAIQVVEGANTIDLRNVGLVGSTITFNVDAIDTGYYLTDITVHAGSGGARLVHPLWVAWKNEVPFTDNADSFKDTVVELNAGVSGPMGVGFFPFVPVPSDSYISLTFEVAEPFHQDIEPDASPASLGGCQDVPSFEANARPQMTVCASCHAAGNAAAGMNLSQLDSDDPDDQRATCNEVLSRVSLATPDNSAIFNSTNPSLSPMHMFSFNGDQGDFDTFKTAMTVWISAEQAAQ
jgi:hypothetical protein